ncbi:hypothetical protein GCM10009535_35700 [Streptomyces thermocarboxydovorans]|uniref:Uncharacterized protein n=1 Tax=Streptomyces thermocarboxydovorans TaxID=59298 RepID=A0ABN1HJ70_9ACTN
MRGSPERPPSWTLEGQVAAAAKGNHGAGAVLLTAFLLWITLHRHRPAALAAAGPTCALGLGWLAFH